MGACFVNFVLFGVVQWMPALTIRRFGLDTSEVGFFFGTAVGLGSALGAVIGGFAANRLVRSNIRWMVRIPFIVSLSYLPVYELAIFSSDHRLMFALVFLINIVGGIAYGPMLAAMQSVVPPTMRAVAAALYGFSASLIGVGVAPLLIGVLSDVFARTSDHGASLQMAVAIALLFSLLSVFHFHRALSLFRRDDAPMECSGPRVSEARKS